MADLPRAHKITALLLITIVVVVTLIVVDARNGRSGADDGTPTDPNATAGPLSVMARERDTWDTIAATVRGAQGTVAPVDCPYVDERVREPNNFLSLTPALTFICPVRGLSATPIAPGRVVMRITQSPLNSFKSELIADGADDPWIRAAAYGPFVAIDHGPMNGVGNLTTIYAGLDSINPDLAIGQLVDTTTPLGSLGARMINDELVNGVLTFELIADDVRFGTDPLRQDPPPIGDGPRLAELVADEISLPVSTCGLPFGNVQLLVGASRDYRSGTHNGLDFECFTTDHVITSSGEGQVLFVVDDFVEPSVVDRDAVLEWAASAVDTPFWSLAMLYGNFVVVDHRLDSGDRAVTIYAHLSQVDPLILPGVLVDASTAIGTAGNSGTSTAAEGITNEHGSVHLHWELHVNDRPIGYLDNPLATEPLYKQILCEPATPIEAPAC